MEGEVYATLRFRTRQRRTGARPSEHPLNTARQGLGIPEYAAGARDVIC